MATVRTCDGCGARMSPWIPRGRRGDQLLCKGCLQRAPEEELMTTGTRKHAHDSGDGATVYHCPFCGSGQVIARSDRTIECEYCHNCFTVQVQPQFPAFPQTINGMPMQVPGMPGAPGGLPPDPGADPLGGQMVPSGQPVPGEEGGPGGDPMSPEGEDGGAPEDAPPGDDGGDDSGGDGPPWAKKSMLRTASGALLGFDDYVRHLAIKYADDKDAVLLRVRAGRNR